MLATVIVVGKLPIRRGKVLRPFGASGYLPLSTVIERIIEVEKLLSIVLHDEPAKHGRINLRPAMFAARLIVRQFIRRLRGQDTSLNLSARE
jgi:hypothetical protein